jgi:hypothetical protein
MNKAQAKGLGISLVFIALVVYSGFDIGRYLYYRTFHFRTDSWCHFHSLEDSPRI